MLWISKQNSLPLYVWEKDLWYNQTDGCTYTADIEKKIWICGEKIINFPPKKCLTYSLAGDMKL